MIEFSSQSVLCNGTISNPWEDKAVQGPRALNDGAGTFITVLGPGNSQNPPETSRANLCPCPLLKSFTGAAKEQGVGGMHAELSLLAPHLGLLPGLGDTLA